eukprot:116959-Pyramimonas_sp.AAC.1
MDGGIPQPHHRPSRVEVPRALLDGAVPELPERWRLPCWYARVFARAELVGFLDQPLRPPVVPGPRVRRSY